MGVRDEEGIYGHFRFGKLLRNGKIVKRTMKNFANITVW